MIRPLYTGFNVGDLSALAIPANDSQHL